MGLSRILIAACAYLKILAVSAQYGYVEYLNQPIVQPVSQFVIPAVIKPLINPEPVPSIPEVLSPPAVPEYPFYPPMIPPIIIKNNNDDDWKNLLCFLILALKNRRPSYDGYGYSSPPGPTSAGGYWNNCGCDDACNCGNNNCVYIPYPVPVPASSFGDGGFGLGDEITYMTNPQQSNGRDNEVTLLIRAE